MAIVELKLVSPIEVVNKDQIITIREEKDGKTPILGKIKISRGTIEWWPKGNKVNAHSLTWAKFAKLMADEVEMKRVKKTAKKKQTAV
ncbi:hypothetical protein [Cupriavidus alkaliphilus]|uniref:Uncharacterized protein n=1 Tax=Cupriavidus alkaliphilus TaxID=942866 RepID=A0A7W4V7T7_9BURK|nr:hypothetical protein [Cupriavidus alkaliphilus]MBB3006025.1 hypothetical protein [Cupriavidus alkaliphilus]